MIQLQYCNLAQLYLGPFYYPGIPVAVEFSTEVKVLGLKWKFDSDRRIVSLYTANGTRYLAYLGHKGFQYIELMEL